MTHTHTHTDQKNRNCTAELYGSLVSAWWFLLHPKLEGVIFFPWKLHMFIGRNKQCMFHSSSTLSRFECRIFATWNFPIISIALEKTRRCVILTPSSQLHISGRDGSMNNVVICCSEITRDFLSRKDKTQRPLLFIECLLRLGRHICPVIRRKWTKFYRRLQLSL